MDVLFSSSGKVGVVTLNRPKVLNALSLNMANEIIAMLRKWEQTNSLVIVKSSNDKAFCSGGDIRAVLESRKRGEKAMSLELQQEQFVLCQITKNYKIPYVALINGVVMGAGCALSVHGKYRIATEKTVFAMPEASIGFIPDVGASYFLSRLTGKLGLYLALTAQNLKGADVYRAGIATHYCSSADLQNIEGTLLTCSSEREIDAALKKYAIQPIPTFTLEKYLEKINTCFSANSVEDIITRLQIDGSDWSQKTLKQLGRVSPTSLKVVFKEINLGSQLSFKECLQMEYRLASNYLEKHDFYEGVRALIIDKDFKPKWNPSTLSEISNEYVDEHFNKTPTDHQLTSKL